MACLTNLNVFLASVFYQITDPEIMAAAENILLSKDSFFKKVPHRKNFVSMGIGLGALALLGSLSYYWFFYLDRYITTDDSYVESEFYPVSTKVAGAIKEILVNEGQKVKKGDVLLTIDDVDLAFERNFKNLKFQKASIDYERSKTLHNTKAISDFDFENADAALKAAEVDLKGTDIKISYTKILAPADGVVAKKSSQVGQLVQPGQSLFVLVGDQKRWIEAYFKETQIENLKVGQHVTITVDGYSHGSFKGKIESIYPSSGAKLSLLPPENSTGNFTRIVQRIPVKISFDDSQRNPASEATALNLKPGMSVEVSVDTRMAAVDDGR